MPRPTAFAFATALTLGLTSATASAISVQVGGTPVAGQGLTSSIVGLLCPVETFNDLMGDDCAGVMYSPTQDVFGVTNFYVEGSVSGEYASPPQNFSGYLTVSPVAGGSVVISLSVPVDYFGFYAGSLDGYNSITFNLSSGTQTYTGTYLNQLAFNTNPTGNQQRGQYFNVFADPGETCTQITLSSTSNAFETDNHAFRAASVPAPAGAALLGLGLLGLAATARRRR